MDASDLKDNDKNQRSTPIDQAREQHPQLEAPHVYEQATILTGCVGGM